MIFLKTALKNIRHELAMHIVTVLQMLATIIITLVMVSSILIRYQYYTPLKEYFQANGLYCIFSTYANSDIETWNAINYGDEMTEEEKDSYLSAHVEEFYMDSQDVLQYLENAQSIVACHQVLAYPPDKIVYDSVSYNDALIESFSPELTEGRWLNTSEDAEELEVVVSQNDYGWKVGDTIELLCASYPNGFYTTAKVVGILKENTKIPYASARDGDDTFQLFYETFSFAVEERPIMLFSSDSIEKLNQLDAFQDNNHILQSVMHSMIVTYPDDYTEAQLLEEQQKLSEIGCTLSVSLQEMDENSREYLYAQVYHLLPIILVLLVLTMVSSISSSALSTRRRLKDYSIYYVNGLQWKHCIIIHAWESIILAGIALIGAGIGILFLQYTVLAEYVKIIWDAWSILSIGGVVVLYILISMLMPAVMIGRNTPKQILTR